MSSIPLEYRNIVKRMLLRANGTPVRISSKDVALEVCKATGCPRDPSLMMSAHDLLINALQNPPEGVQVQEAEGYHLTVLVRRVHQ
jgi:hypothetical protein